MKKKTQYTDCDYESTIKSALPHTGDKWMVKIISNSKHEQQTTTQTVFYTVYAFM